MIAYPVTIFLASFLLFQVEPLISKLILPWFGGAASVWTVCMLFFQVMLLAGYLYAHVLSTRIRLALQPVLHTVLLALSAFAVPFKPEAAVVERAVSIPEMQIFLILALSIGAPFFVLSTTALLMQAWYGAIFPDRSPYRLYALSNFGSFLALISYPFFVEPLIGLQEQIAVWSVGYILFCLSCAYCGVLFRRDRRYEHLAEREEERPKSAPLDRYRVVLWVLLAAAPSALFLAVTNHICQDVASLPLLWIVPLSIYLLSFVLCFERDGWYRRRPYMVLFAVTLVWIMFGQLRESGISLGLTVGLYFVALFLGCMISHGELVKLKPTRQSLTRFYICMAVGGCLGGLFVGIISPLTFSSYIELPLALQFICLLLIAVLSYRDRWRVRGVCRPWLVNILIVLLAVGAVVSTQYVSNLQGGFKIVRNFYGILRLKDKQGAGAEDERRYMYNGHIEHGFQYLRGDKQGVPTAYYGEATPVAPLFRELLDGKGRKIGIVGLGVGTLAAYSRRGDEFRFYEINPAVEDLAREYFSFLDDSAGEVRVILGDARLRLQAELDQSFDIFVLDAFSGDAIPVHLVTVEAMEVYLRHLKPDGILAFHISNNHIDLAPVLHRLAKHFELESAHFRNRKEAASYQSDYVLMARDPKVFGMEQLQKLRIPDSDRKQPLWTDNYSNLLSVLK